MAQFDDFETDEAHAAPLNGAVRFDVGAGAPRIGTLVNWAGAVISLGLVIGMVVWAYQLTVRDMSGVPVIRALEGPMRVAPADPGGTQAEHQGLAVNRLAEGAEAAPVPDQLILAPPPVDLDVIALASASAPAPNPDPVTAPAELAPTPEAPTTAEVNASTQALIERLMDRAEPLGPVSAASPPPAEATLRPLWPAGAKPPLSFPPRCRARRGRCDRRRDPQRLRRWPFPALPRQRWRWTLYRTLMPPTCRKARGWSSLAPSTRPRLRAPNGTG